MQTNRAAGKAAMLLATVSWLATLHAAGAAEIVDRFDSGGWSTPNSKAPATLEVDEGRLVLEDHPGGEVTWGSMAAKRFEDIDLREIRYLVIDLKEVTARFGVKLTGSGRDGWPKERVLRDYQPGLKVIDIPEATGWEKGEGHINLGLYALGDGSRIRVGSVKMTGTLNDEEQAALAASERPGPRQIEHAGLDTLASRSGRKPVAADPAEGELTIYTDPMTGHRVWRMTDHPAIDRHEYYDVRAWNADGSRIFFSSRRPGRRRWLMDADGTNIRQLPEPADGESVRDLYWSRDDPHQMCFVRSGSERIRIMHLDVRDGGVSEVVSVPLGRSLKGRRFSGMTPPHPDGEHFLLRWGGQDDDPTLLASVDAATGEHRLIDVGFPTHRVRFTRHPEHTIFVNSNTDPDEPGSERRTSWIIEPDGTKRRLSVGGSHPDWSPRGRYLGTFGSGSIWLTPHDGGEPHRLVRTEAGGHGGFSITTGRYHVADATDSGPYANTVFVTELETGRVERIAYHGSSYSGWESGVPDPEATHPAPVSSPDETKILYDSDMLGQPDLWMAVRKLPQPPREVRFNDGTLRWRPAKLSRETAGYNVYRKEGDYWRTVQTGVKKTRLDGLKPGRYAVAAEEWSGLESRFAMADSAGLSIDRTAPPRPEPPRVEATEGTSIALRWSSARAADIDHYNVYASTDDHVIPSNATLVGSSRSNRFIDWGLQTDTPYRYRVTAVDRHGHESLPSAAVAAHTAEHLRVRAALRPAAWRTNRRAPADLERSGDRLVFTDQPGGEITWGSSIGQRVRGIDLDRTPYLVLDVPHIGERFQVKLLSSESEREKTSVLKTDRTGRHVIDVPEATGWSGTGDIRVRLYTLGDGSRIEIAGVSFSSDRGD